MKRAFPFKGIRGRLLLLLLIILVPIILIEGFIYYKRFERRKAEELQANLEVARALARTFDAFVADVVHTELAIGLAATASPPPSRDSLRRILKEAEAVNPVLRSFTWITPKGIHLVTTNPKAENRPIASSSWPEFSRLRSEDWAVTPVYISPLTGESVFTISRGIRDPKGKLLGVVSSTAVANKLDSLLAFQRSEEAGVSLIDNKGMLVYRYPVMQYTWEQRNWLKHYPMIVDSLRGKDVLASVISESTGQKRLVAFTPVSSFGWVTAASRAEDEVMKAITSTLLFQAGLVLLVTLAGFGAAAALAKPISKSIIGLRNHALALGRGEMETFAITSGPDELKDLSIVFEQMAGEVSSREAALRESEQRWVTTLASVGDAVISADVEGKITFMNATAEELTGWTTGEAAKKPATLVFNIINEQNRRQVESPITKVLREGTVVGLANHTILMRKDGTEVPIDDSGAPIRDREGKTLGVVLVFHDITARRRAEEALQQRTSELQHLTETLEVRVKERTTEIANLSSHLVSAQEDERRRVSYDLHDNAWQALVAIRFEMEHLFSDREEMDRAALQKKSKKIMDDLLEAVGKIRSMQGDLWPYVLDDIGILATIDWYCREFEKNHPGLSIERQESLAENEIPSSAKIVIYRILQETLGNVAKHSQASRVTLCLQKNDHQMEFTVKDNGLGFDPEEIMVKRSPWGGLGLLNIKARTELSGGLFGVESVTGQGTMVRASWPL